MANPDLPDSLKTEPLFPNRHSDPEGSLMVFEPVPGDPSGSLRELDVIQENEQVRPPGFVKEPREGREVGLIGGKDHKKCLKCPKCQKCLKLKNQTRALFRPIRVISAVRELTALL
jgi:hypothetical protein